MGSISFNNVVACVYYNVVNIVYISWLSYHIHTIRVFFHTRFSVFTGDVVQLVNTLPIETPSS